LSRTARALREANDKLTQLSAQKDAFLGQISHELRTPMTSIRAFSEILTEADVPADMVAQSGHVIHAEALRLTRLLDDLLDLSVLENGTVQLNLAMTSVGAVLDQAIAAAGEGGTDSPLIIQREPGAEAIYLRTDPDRLVQVAINLVTNARRYCDAPQPVLRIAVRQRGGRVMIDFIDNGRGIAKEARGLVFEKFARLTDQSRSAGAGLGLAICREVMARLGGTVSYLPGQGGAAFRIALPLQIDRVAA
jgi:signal transduction histidine kinase